MRCLILLVADLALKSKQFCLEAIQTSSSHCFNLTFAWSKLIHSFDLIRKNPSHLFLHALHVQSACVRNSLLRTWRIWFDFYRFTECDGKTSQKGGETRIIHFKSQFCAWICEFFVSVNKRTGDRFWSIRPENWWTRRIGFRRGALVVQSTMKLY